jgi:hypothetical protein
MLLIEPGSESSKKIPRHTGSAVSRGDVEVLELALTAEAFGQMTCDISDDGVIEDRNKAGAREEGALGVVLTAEVRCHARVRGAGQCVIRPALHHGSDVRQSCLAVRRRMDCGHNSVNTVGLNMRLACSNAPATVRGVDARRKGLAPHL